VTNVNESRENLHVAVGSDHPHEHQLVAGALGLFESAVMALAGSAPSYSIAASTATLFAAVAIGGPASLLYCGIAMFGIVFAFNYLGRVEANAGASYSWVRRALHPTLGFMSGWAMLVSTMLFVVFGSFPAGSVTLGLFSTSLANNITAVTLVGSLFFLAIVVVVAAGVKLTATVQVVMSSVEVVLLVLFVILAFVHAHHVRAFSWHWFSPTVFHGTSGFFAGALIAAFYYWGWDVVANLNEETKGGRRTPGIGGILGVCVVFLLFESYAVATNLVLSAHTISNNAGNVLGVLGQAVWPGFGGKLIVVAVVLSTVATLETSLIQLTRTMFAMGRDGTLPKMFGRLHAQRKSPVTATIVIAILGIVLFVASNYVHSVGALFSDAINALGLQIAIYYSLAGISVVILYRKQLFTSVGNFIFMGLWPLVGSIFMVVMFIKVLPGLNGTTIIVSMGAMALGLIPMFYYWAKGNPYYKRATKLERVAQIQEIEEMEELL
jgi:amino acid transporter